MRAQREQYRQVRCMLACTCSRLSALHTHISVPTSHQKVRVQVLRGASMHANACAFVSSLPGVGARRTSCARCPQKAEPVAAQSRMAGAAPLRDANSEVLNGVVVGKLQSHAHVGQCGSRAPTIARTRPQKYVLRTAVTAAPAQRHAVNSGHGSAGVQTEVSLHLPRCCQRCD